MFNKNESLESKKTDLSLVKGGMSQAAVDAANNVQWLTRSNVHMRATGETHADVGIGNDPFGDLALDSNQPNGG